jgi:hypothetical protein
MLGLLLASTSGRQAAGRHVREKAASARAGVLWRDSGACTSLLRDTCMAIAALRGVHRSWREGSEL